MRLVVDTGVFSAALSRRRRPAYDRQVNSLLGHQLFLCVVTVAELRYGETAEEWAVHDYEGFGDIRVDENHSLATIAKWAEGIERHGEALAAWVAQVGEQSEDLIEQFEDRYQGEWESIEAYAAYLLDELGAQRVIDDAPEWLQPYLKLDVEGFARDLEISGDIAIAATSTSTAHVFSAT